MLSQFDDEETAAYFERLNAQLRRMPQADRAEIHTEVRQHLDDLAKAHEELGATTDEAQQAALRQFGDPVKIGRRLFDEWARTPQKNVWYIPKWAYLRLCLPQIVISLVFITFMRVRGPSSSADALLVVNHLLPILVGAWAGRRFGLQAFPGLLLMSGAVLLTLPLLDLIFVFWDTVSHRFMPSAIPDTYSVRAHFQQFQHPLLMLASAWLAQRVDFPSQLSIAGVKSRFRR